LADKLREQRADEIVTEMVDSLLDHGATADPFLRRRKWCLAQIHTREELATMVRRGIATFTGLNGLSALDADAESSTDATAPPSRPGDGDGLHGNDVFAADLWDAWFGLAGLREHEGGTGWGAAEDIDWGEELGDVSFQDVADALEYSADLTAQGIDNTGVFLGSDGLWHVNYDPNSSD